MFYSYKREMSSRPTPPKRGLFAVYVPTAENALADPLSVRVWLVGAVVQLVEYRTRNQEVAGWTHNRSTVSNLEQVANLLCAQANSACYPQRDGK